MWQKYCNVLIVLVGGYLINFMPYFFLEQQLFLHHYLPSLTFKLILFATLYELTQDIINDRFKHKVMNQRLRVATNCVTLAVIAAIGKCFIRLLPLCYGYGQLSSQDIQDLKYREDWHLIVHKI